MTSYNVHLLFHNTGRLIQTNSGAREHLLFEIPAGTRKTMGTDAVIRTDWSTFTSVIGPTVKGNSTRLFLSFFCSQPQEVQATFYDVVLLFGVVTTSKQHRFNVLCLLVLFIVWGFSTGKCIVGKVRRFLIDWQFCILTQQNKTFYTFFNINRFIENLSYIRTHKQEICTVNQFTHMPYTWQKNATSSELIYLVDLSVITSLHHLYKFQLSFSLSNWNAFKFIIIF